MKKLVVFKNKIARKLTELIIKQEVPMRMEYSLEELEHYEMIATTVNTSKGEKNFKTYSPILRYEKDDKHQILVGRFTAGIVRLFQAHFHATAKSLGGFQFAHTMDSSLGYYAIKIPLETTITLDYEPEALLKFVPVQITKQLE